MGDSHRPSPQSSFDPPWRRLGGGFQPGRENLSHAVHDSIRLWDRESLQPLWERTDSKWVTAVAFYPEGNKALFINGGFAQVRDLATGGVIGPPRFHPGGGIHRLALSPNGQSVLVNGPDGVARLQDVATGKPLG